ncbi:MAG: hypothetical protein IT457_10660 [Planctomycetes bacterium]|nr:hypothetical protein [Planctomycetota bacterium]
MTDSATRRIGELLAPLTNWERTRADRPRFTLDTIRALLRRLGQGLEKPARFAVQVGGSKGKGSTCAWLAMLASSAGLRVGTYASPHVQTIRERVVLPEGLCPEEQLVAAVTRALGAAKGLDPAPSAFEVLTAAAAICFAESRLDLAIWEVGLGGRLDATTALPVELSVLTAVELEHTQVLGETIGAIAAEKAHIFRPGARGVLGCLGEAARVAEAHAATVGCRLLVLDREFGATAAPPAADGSRELTLWSTDGVRQSTRVADAPRHELVLLALAWAALRSLVPDFALPQTLARPGLPGRFECLLDRDGQPIVLDGAHTEESTARLAEELARRWPDRRFAFLYASAKGKRWREALSRIAPLADQVVVTELADTASEDPLTICDWLRSRGVRVRAVPGAADGLDALRTHAGPRVVMGSFHLVGELRERIL